VTLGPELASCWLKIGRAEEHFNIFQSELSAWTNDSPYTIRREVRLDGGRHTIVVDIQKVPPIDRWSLIAGDCVGNLRSSLDHLIYALAVRNTGKNPPPDARKLQFPICDSETSFQGEKKRGRVNGLSTSTGNLIERIQPYNKWHAHLPSLLSVLRDFSDQDKHRLLNIALSHVTSGQINFVPPRRTAVPIYWLKNPITTGSQIAFFELDPPEPDVQYEVQVTFGITIAHTPGPQGRHVSPLATVLNSLIAEVKRILDAVVTI
jgi:hypothetical protein